ncbi:MAG: hypothetical protein K9L59_16830 [Desulfobacterales bacterium]|nr:hypothetical protein [Desulfobacterales bacterium]MCF8079620.1 hypothetical protein [Desulfobacterales bacterium]
MENSQEAAAFFTMLKHTVESHGCKIVDVDFENHKIDIDGPDENVADCAAAIGKLMD